MTRSLSRQTLLAVPVAFAATLAVLVLLMGAGRGDGVAGPAADAAARRAAPDAPSPRATTDQRIRILQATVRADPRRADGYVLLADAYARLGRSIDGPDPENSDARALSHGSARPATRPAQRSAQRQVAEFWTGEDACGADARRTVVRR